MDTETITAIVCAGIGVAMTPVYVVLLAKGVRSLGDMRELFSRPPGSRRSR